MGFAKHIEDFFGDPKNQEKIDVIEEIIARREARKAEADRIAKEKEDSENKKKGNLLQF